MDRSTQVLGLIAVIVVVAVAGGAVYMISNSTPVDVHTSEPHVEYYGNGGVTSDGKQWIDSTMDTVIRGSYLFTRTGYEFTSWNTKADGTGDTYVTDQSVSMGTKLYAQWYGGGESTITASLHLNGSVSYYNSITYVSGDKTYSYNEGPFTPKAGDYIVFTPGEGYSATISGSGFSAVKYVDKMCTGYSISVSATDSSGNEVIPVLSIDGRLGKIAVPTDKSTYFTIMVSYGIWSEAVFNSNSDSSAISCSVDFKTDGSGCKYYTARSGYSECKFTWDGHYVKSWNTAKDGSGTSYSVNDDIPYADDNGTPQTVYAQWGQSLGYKFTYPDGSTCPSDLEYTFKCGTDSVRIYYDSTILTDTMGIAGPFSIVITADTFYIDKMIKVDDTTYTFSDKWNSNTYQFVISTSGFEPTSIVLSEDGKTLTMSCPQPSSDSVCSFTLTFTQKTS